ncbi:NAD-dependent epimerase/dehydratase family protein [Specibacter cremeus]|uniref:NAD-dependent epimerase/dehydratase family protein n=1 Tax=Specibacter cremeus TaxID=1629051 RepID=UPI000F76E059|nr:NAD-dependent epimerase/dehydratase family protein [Specibacter cremeus]
MRAIILGGTGAIGGATASRLAAAGWTVDVVGRDPAAMPAELASINVRFHAVERSDTRGIQQLVGDGVDLLVDLLAYRGADVRELLPVMASAATAVLVSSRAVYVDSFGRHVNGGAPPRFDGAIKEDTPTLPPAGNDVDPFSREGYARSKVAAEQVALDSGLPVTIIRPSKVHGRWARNARTRSFVERMLRGERAIALADRGTSIDHLSAAVNTAALIETIAVQPAPRILNSADPDTPNAEQIVRAIGTRLDWGGRLELLDNGDPHPERGQHPWRSAHPMVLDTTASELLGYVPVGSGLDLIMEEVDWVATHLNAR